MTLEDKATNYTVMAALHLWKSGLPGLLALPYEDILLSVATNGGEVEALTESEIDRLINKLNSNEDFAGVQN